MGRCTLPFPSWSRSGSLGLISALTGSVRRVLIPFLLQTRRYLLEDVDLDQTRDIGHSPGRDEDFLDRRGRFVRSFGRRYRERE